MPSEGSLRPPTFDYHIEAGSLNALPLFFVFFMTLPRIFAFARIPCSLSKRSGLVRLNHGGLVRRNYGGDPNRSGLQG